MGNRTNTGGSPSSKRWRLTYASLAKPFSCRRDSSRMPRINSLYIYINRPATPRTAPVPPPRPPSPEARIAASRYPSTGAPRTVVLHLLLPLRSTEQTPPPRDQRARRASVQTYLSQWSKLPGSPNRCKCGLYGKPERRRCPCAPPCSF